MKVRIRTFSHIREILGEDNLFEYPEGISIKELLKTLRQKAGEAGNQLFSGNGELSGNLVLMLNGARVYKEDLESLILFDGDEIALFSPVSGG